MDRTFCPTSRYRSLLGCAHLRFALKLSVSYHNSPQTGRTNAGLARRHERVITPHCQRPELQRGGGDFQAKTPSSEEARQRQLYRVNQKLERDDLRRQVVELVDQHARMKQAQANEKARFKASRPPAYYLWKSFALRQREER